MSSPCGNVRTHVAVLCVVALVLQRKDFGNKMKYIDLLRNKNFVAISAFHSIFLFRDKPTMEKRLLVLIIILVISICLAIASWYFLSFKNSASLAVSEARAIEIIKNRFSELREYPSATKLIKTEKADDGWYVSFMQQGLGAQISDARCYWVKDNNKIMQKDYTPQGPAFVGEFSLEQCRLVAK